jgi:LPXTG-motif cell wall-anchored protein
MSAKSALRLIGSAATEDPGVPGDPGGVSMQRPVAEETGTLPTTGLDLEGIAVVAIGLVMAGGGSMLASRRLRKRNG